MHVASGVKSGAEVGVLEGVRGLLDRAIGSRAVSAAAAAAALFASEGAYAQGTSLREVPANTPGLIQKVTPSANGSVTNWYLPTGVQKTIDFTDAPITPGGLLPANSESTATYARGLSVLSTSFGGPVQITEISARFTMRFVEGTVDKSPAVALGFRATVFDGLDAVDGNRPPVGNKDPFLVPNKVSSYVFSPNDRKVIGVPNSDAAISWTPRSDFPGDWQVVADLKSLFIVSELGNFAAGMNVLVDGVSIGGVQNFFNAVQGDKIPGVETWHIANTTMTELSTASAARGATIAYYVPLKVTVAMLEPVTIATTVAEAPRLAMKLLSGDLHLSFSAPLSGAYSLAVADELKADATWRLLASLPAGTSRVVVTATPKGAESAEQLAARDGAVVVRSDDLGNAAFYRLQ